MPKKYNCEYDRRTYVAWKNIFTRTQKFPTYIKNGIKVHPDWETFENFVRDMGMAPAGKCLDRIDTLGDYAPGNCRWTTQKENCRNTTANCNIDGKCISAHAEELGIKANTLLYRLRRDCPRGLSSNTSRTRAVRCKETGAVYPSVEAAAIATGANSCSLSRALRTPRYTSGGLHWEPVDEEARRAK